CCSFFQVLVPIPPIRVREVAEPFHLSCKLPFKNLLDPVLLLNLHVLELNAPRAALGKYIIGLSAHTGFNYSPEAYAEDFEGIALVNWPVKNRFDEDKESRK